MIRKTFALSFYLFILVNVAFAAPTVRKVDPPNWFVGRGNPMLLIYGEGLAGASVSSSLAAVRVQKTESSPNGHYLFVWLDVPATARPATVPLTIKTIEGITSMQYPIRALRNASDGRKGLAADDVVYLLMPDRFADGDPSNNNPPSAPNTYDRAKPKWYHGGDIRGLREHLLYLKGLGVTAVWMTPFVDNENTSSYDAYHGYGAVDMYAVDEHYGTLSEVQDLVDYAHQQGMKIIFDWVANHTGPHHPWVADPPTPSWYHGSMQKHVPPDYEFPPITNIHDTAAKKTPITNGWFADILADLNQDDPHVAQYLLQNAVWWAEQTGIDAYRLDTFPYVPRQFWSDWNRSLHGWYPQLDTIGENFNADPTVVSYFLGGRVTQGVDTGLNTAFDFPMMFALRDVFARNAPVKRIADVLRQDWLYPNAYRLVPMLGNHDTNRFLTEVGGNRVALENATALLLTMRGIPQLYYGDEIGMTGDGDPDNRRDFPGGFPGDTQNAFSPAGRTTEQQDVFFWTQSLLKLRKQHPALTSGMHWNLAADDTSYVFEREAGDDRVLVAFNHGDAPKTTTIDVSQLPLAKTQTLTVLLGEAKATRNGGNVVIEMPAQSVTLILAR
jgi:glycosidase